MKTSQFVSLFLFCFLIQQNCYAQWSSVLSVGGDVDFLARTGDTLIAGGLSVLQFSSDHGDHWTDIQSGLPQFPSITGIQVKGQELFVSIMGNGVYHSPDFGNSWNEFNTGLVEPFIWGIAVNESFIFAVSTNGNVYQSSITSPAWSSSFNGGSTITEIIADGDNIYTGSISNGIFVSNNSGGNWTEINEGIPRGSTNHEKEINKLALSPQGTLYATVRGEGVFQFDAQSQSWSALTNGITDVQEPPFHDYHGLYCNNNVIIVGNDNFNVFMSDDYGQHFQNIRDGSPLRTDDLTVQGGYIFVATSQVMRRAIDTLFQITSIDIREQQSYVDIFPNPTTDLVQISGNISFDWVEIVSLDGRILHRTTMPTIHLSAYPKGLYLIRIGKAEQLLYTQKILRQ
ncbi:MAG: T9SS type A sorting domain-containing protein [Bacteroidota bacterium]